MASMTAAATKLDRQIHSGDLDALPHEWDTRYELIGGVLHMSRRPSFEHQAFIARLMIAMGPSVLAAGGQIVQEPGLVWDDASDDNVSPDLAVLLRTPRPGRGEKLRQCPEIVVEVLSGGEEARRRDLEAKRDLYFRRGATEYLIADLESRELLQLTRTAAASDWGEAKLGPADLLSTPIFPGWPGIRLGEVFGSA